MSNRNRFIRGFARLSVVLFAMFWVFLPLWTINENSKHMNLIHNHLFVFAGSTPLPSTWPVLIATDEFAAKPIEEKRKLAEEYFEKNIKSLAREYYFDTIRFEEWFVRTATLSVGSSDESMGGPGQSKLRHSIQRSPRHGYAAGSYMAGL